MEVKKTLTISVDTATCAARHIVAAHESACTNKPVDFGGICGDRYQAVCSAPCVAAYGSLDWLEMMRPIFDATGIYPSLGRGSYPDLEDCFPNQS